MVSPSKHEIWKERIADYRSSGLKAQEWCGKNNLPLSSLRYWVYKFNKEAIVSRNFVKEFVPVEAPGIIINPTASIIIRIGNISIDVSDGCHPDTLRNVLEALGAYA
jgi:hypothetical protein